jgi:hypothetical protein
MLFYSLNQALATALNAGRLVINGTIDESPSNGDFPFGIVPCNQDSEN